MKAGAVQGLHQIVEEDRQQRAALVLRDVDYVIEAHFDLTDRAGPEDTAAKHHEMFTRRAARGQCFHHPCLGTREFAADFALVQGDLPPCRLPPDQRDRDLGWMLLDIDYAKDRTPLFFRAALRDGVLSVPAPNAPEVRS